MKKLLVLILVLALAGAAYWYLKPQKEETEIPIIQNEAPRNGEILSLDIEPSTVDGGWTMYKDGAKAVLMGKNLESAKIKTMPTGTGMGELYPDGVLMGEMKLLSETGGVQVWELEMRNGIMATDMWAEAVDEEGKVIMSKNMGNVGYE